MRTALLALVGIAFTVGRFTLVSHHRPSVGGSFEAFAHLAVGGAIGAACATPDRAARRAFGLTAAALTAVEIVAFIVTR